MGATRARNPTIENRLEEFLAPLQSGLCVHYDAVKKPPHCWVTLSAIPLLGRFWHGIHDVVFLCNPCFYLFQSCVKDLQHNFLKRRPLRTQLDRDQFILLLEQSTSLVRDTCKLVAQYGHVPVSVSDPPPSIVTLSVISTFNVFAGLLRGQQLVEIIQSRQSYRFMIRVSNGLLLVGDADCRQRIEFDRDSTVQKPSDEKPSDDAKRIYLKESGCPVPALATWLHKTIETITVPLSRFLTPRVFTSNLLMFTTISRLSAFTPWPDPVNFPNKRPLN